jgi:hypothetical protein
MTLRRHSASVDCTLQAVVMFPTLWDDETLKPRIASGSRDCQLSGLLARHQRAIG